MSALSIGLSLGANPFVPPTAFTVGFTGLTDGEARPGSEAGLGYTVAPDTGSESTAWGTTPGDTSYGIGPSPTDFSAGDGSLLWLTISDVGQTHSIAAPIRHAAPTPAMTLPDVTLPSGSAGPITTSAGFSFAGTATYSLETAPSGLTIDPATGDIDPSAIVVTTDAPIVVRISDANGPNRFADTGFNLTIEAPTLSISTEPSFATAAISGGTLTDLIGIIDLGSAITNTTPPEEAEVALQILVDGQARTADYVLLRGQTVTASITYSAAGAADLLRMATPFAVDAATINVTDMPSLDGIGTIEPGETPADIVARMTDPGLATTNGLGTVASTVDVLISGFVISTSTPLSDGDDLTLRVTFTAPGADNVIVSLGPITVTNAADIKLNQTANGEIEIDSATGEVTVTVSSPAVYASYNAGNGAGIFTFESADFASGPVNLVPPRIVDDGTPANGETLTYLAGLWIYDADAGGLGSEQIQWQADAGGNGTFANIASGTLTSSESGDDVRVVATLADNNGSRSAASVAVSVAAAPVATGAFFDDFTGPTIGNYTFNAADFAIDDPADELHRTVGGLGVIQVTSPPTLPDNYKNEIVLSAGPPPTIRVYIWRNTSISQFGAFLSLNTGDGAWFINDGSASVASGSVGLVAGGSSVSLEISGTTLTAKINNVIPTGGTVTINSTLTRANSLAAAINGQFAGLASWSGGAI